MGVNVYYLDSIPAGVVARTEENAGNNEVLKWAGVFPIAPIGSLVNVHMNNLGEGLIESYFHENGWLGVRVNLINPPAWHVKQSKGTKHEGHALVFGKEITVIQSATVPDINKVPELADLDLCLIECDESTSLVSLKHNAILLDAERYESSEGLPYINLGQKVKGDETHEMRACIESGLKPDEGFPGWAVIFRYINNHRYLLKRT